MHNGFCISDYLLIHGENFVLSGVLNYRERFEELLRQREIRPKPNVMARLQRVRETAIITASTSEEAFHWYEWIKAIPQTSTRDHFLNITGYQLSGMHPQLDGILLAADTKGL